MSQVELHLRPGGGSIIVDGEDVAHLVDHLVLEHSGDGNSVPRLTLMYPCYEVEVDGHMSVTHFCPLADRRVP